MDQDRENFGESDLRQRGPVDMLREQGVAWRGGDIVCLGRSGVYERLAEVAAVLLCLHHEGGRMVDHIVLAPPPGPAGDDAWKQEFEPAFSRDLVHLTGQDLSEADLELALRQIRIRRPADLSVAAVIDLVRGADPRTAILVPNAAVFRSVNPLGGRQGVTIPEDHWAPHLAALAAAVAEEAREVYLHLEAGEFAPERQANLDLLCGIEPFGVLTATRDGPQDVEMADRTERWLQLIAEGRLGSVTTEINALDMDEQRKTLIRLQLFNEAGLNGHVLATLRSDPALVEGLSPRETVMVARMAEAADADEIAVRLLQDVLPRLDGLELLEAGLLTADRTQDVPTVRAYTAALERLFPASIVLLRLSVRARVLAGDHRGAAELCAVDPDFEPARRFYTFLADQLEAEGLDGRAVVAETERQFPDSADEARYAVAEALEHRSRRKDGLALLLATDDGAPSRFAVTTALSMLERGLLSDDGAVDDDLAAAVVQTAAVRLAAEPTDGLLRLRLTRLLRPDLLGLRAPALMMVLLLDGLTDETAVRPTPQLDDRPPGLDDKAGSALFRRVAKWLVREGVSIIGSRRYPIDELKVDPERAAATLQSLVTLAGERLNDEDELATMETILAITAAVAPHAEGGVADLAIFRVAAAKYVLAGHMQRARDLAEHMLLMAGDDPARRRAAWFGFADTYARLRNGNEALVGLICALSTGGSVSWDQVWYESNLVFRLLRDHGAMVLNRRVLVGARRALEAVGAQQSYGHRLAFMETQVDLAEYEARGVVDQGRLNALIARAMQVALGGGDRREESPASVSLLAQVLRTARAGGVEPPAAATALLAALVRESNERLRPLLEAMSATHPSVEDVAAIAAQIDEPRHAEDTGFNVRMLSVLAGRLLDGPEAGAPEVALFAGELLADQAIDLPAEDGGRPQVPRLPTRLGAPLELARATASSGIDVVALSLSDTGLTRTMVSGCGQVSTVREEPSVFSLPALKTWRETFPYGYRDNREPNVFYTSTEAIGVSALPERAALVMSIDLQGYPPNLLRLGEDLAGRTHRLASAPSLTWLTAARAAPPRAPRSIAWIPDAAPAAGWPILQTVAAELRPIFEDRNVALATGPSPPTDMAGSELVMVAAHGALVDGERRFFRSVHDDVDVAIAGSALSGALASVGVAVLFVCSGGRVDAHPGASTTIGLVKQLLNGGCSAVIAPPWPLYVGVPRHWIPRFLEAWRAGETVVDACFLANHAVLAELGDDPAFWLAMSVYGDPAFRSSMHLR